MPAIVRRNLFAFLFVCVWFFSVIGSGQTTKSSKMLLPVLQDGKWGYIDRTGKISIRPQFDDAGDFSEELARVKIGEKWGYIDKTGHIIIEPRFDDARDFSEQRACVMLKNASTFERNWGYIDKKGRMVIKLQFNFAEDFSEELASVSFSSIVSDMVVWGYIDRAGKMVIPCRYMLVLAFDDVTPNNIWGKFSEGLAVARISQLTGYGYIDKT